MGHPDDLPLHGIVVLDFSQFLAGPVAALRLADLGARVIKIERPATGEIGRNLAFAGRRADGDTLSFHAMNRNKEAVIADLKDPADLVHVRDLVDRADVVVQNFRPGVMERIGLDHATLRARRPELVYASASGYGASGPWSRRPGQDLLAQSIGALPWRSHGEDGRPRPVGLALADHLMSCHLAQGVTALLVRRFRTGRGGLVETSLLEAVLDLQRDPLTARLNDVTPDPPAAPYGLHATSDGHLAVATTSMPDLARAVLPDPDEPRDVAGRIARHLRSAPTEHWVTLLDQAGIDAGPVLTLEQLLAHPGFAESCMTQTVIRPPAAPGAAPVRLTSMRSPLRIDGTRPSSERAAPRLGAQGRLGVDATLPGLLPADPLLPAETAAGHAPA